MITGEREGTEKKTRIPSSGSAGGQPPSPPPGDGGPWWLRFPPMPGSPRPMNRRNVLLGSAVMGPFVLIVDGLLGGAAWLATGNLIVGLAVWGSIAFVSSLELGLVAWMAKVRQDRAARG